MAWRMRVTSLMGWPAKDGLGFTSSVRPLARHFQHAAAGRKLPNLHPSKQVGRHSSRLRTIRSCPVPARWGTGCPPHGAVAATGRDDMDGRLVVGLTKGLALVGVLAMAGCGDAPLPPAPAEPLAEA